jgi:hypothetical protein
MKADLAVYGRVYADKLRLHERKFLGRCLDTPLWRLRKPWRNAAWGKAGEEHCADQPATSADSNGR